MILSGSSGMESNGALKFKKGLFQESDMTVFPLLFSIISSLPIYTNS